MAPCRKLLLQPLQKTKVLAATRPGYAAEIRSKWSESVLAILEVGRLLTAAKLDLPHGEFSSMIEQDLPFGDRAAQMLMAIAAHPLLSNPKHVSLLPPSWGTLYQLSRVPAATLAPAIESGTVCPDMSRDDAYRLYRRVQLGSGGAITSPRLGNPFACEWCGAIDKLGRIDSRDDHENQLTIRLYKCGACGKNTMTIEKSAGKSGKEYAAG